MPYKDKDKQKDYQKKHYKNNKLAYSIRSRNAQIALYKKLYDYKATLSCLYCGKSHARLIDFHHNGDKKDTVSKILRKTRSWEKTLEEIKKCDAVCANCHHKLHKKNIKELKYTDERKRNLVKWFYDYKSTLQCELCNEKEPCCLEFHHERDKIKDVSYCAGKGWSKQKILNEIAKCRVLCSNCHRLLHWENSSD